MEDDGPPGSSGGSRGYWKQNLYLLQEKAPKPNAVVCRRQIPNKIHFGVEFHGLIDRNEAERMLLDAGEGAYLVRESNRSRDACTLCMVFDGNVMNYKLYYDGQFYVGDKRFDTMDLLVADSLISMFVDLHAADYIKRMADEAIYEDSPYSRYTNAATTSDIVRRPVTRAHNFNSYTFKASHYCDYCRSFLWGMVRKSMKRIKTLLKFENSVSEIELTWRSLNDSTQSIPKVERCRAERPDLPDLDLNDDEEPNAWDQWRNNFFILYDEGLRRMGRFQRGEVIFPGNRPMYRELLDDVMPEMVRQFGEEPPHLFNQMLFVPNEPTPPPELADAEGEEEEDREEEDREEEDREEEEGEEDHHQQGDRFNDAFRDEDELPDDIED